MIITIVFCFLLNTKTDILFFVLLRMMNISSYSNACNLKKSKNNLLINLKENFIFLDEFEHEKGNTNIYIVQLETRKKICIIDQNMLCVCGFFSTLIISHISIEYKAQLALRLHLSQISLIFYSYFQISIHSISS